MRTSLLVLVQVSGLIFASAAIAQRTSGYGSDQSSAPAGSTTTTRGTVLDMPNAEASKSAPAVRPDTPPRGMTKSRVLANYGKPVSQNGPVGQPPISRWDYPDYRLYFEYDHVLHAVVPGQPEPIAHTEELQTSAE